MPNEHVWAGAAKGVPVIGDGDPVTDLAVHGRSPSEAGFGATVFDTSDSSGHSQYYQGQSLRNLARIAVGRYDDVERRPPD